MIGETSSHCRIPQKLRPCISVVLNAQAAFRLIGPGCPEHRLQAAGFLSADISRAKLADAGDRPADQLIQYMQRLQVFNGLGAVCYSVDDIPAMVEGALPQRRVTKLSSRPAGREKLAPLVEQSMTIW